ncbi:MAG TPA: hypothetical protein VIY48_12225 [Candidatus Paceibacterota bacterium]
MDFTDLSFVLTPEGIDDTEVQLIELAHTVSMDKDKIVATHGRALKKIIPAWLSFLRAEMDRDEEYGPGNAVYALCRTFSLITALTALGTMKLSERKGAVSKALSDLFTNDVGLILEKGVVRDPTQNKSPTTH